MSIITSLFFEFTNIGDILRAPSIGELVFWSLSMAALEKNEKTLHISREELSSQALRFGLIRCSILFVMIISFSHAVEQIAGRELKKKQNEKQPLQNGLGSKKTDIELLKRNDEEMGQELESLKALTKTPPNPPNSGPRQSAPALNAKVYRDRLTHIQQGWNSIPLVSVIG